MSNSTSNNVKVSLIENEEILTLLRCNPSIGNTKLAQKANISFPTLQKRLEDLKKHKILDDKDAINPNAFFSIGISIGSAQAKLVIMNGKYELLSKEDFTSICEKYDVFNHDFLLKENSNNSNGYRYFKTPDNLLVLKSYIDLILKDALKLHGISSDESQSLVPPILGIGIALTGSVNAEKQIIIKSHTIEYLQNISLEILLLPDTLLALRTNGISIVVDHNAKAVAVAEKFSLYNPNNPNHYYRNKKNVASVFLGSGIGCGLILNNRLIRGSRNLSGELGHIQVPRYPGLSEKELIDPKCSCGATYCFEHLLINDVFEMKRSEFKNATSSDINNYLDELSAQDIQLKKQKLMILGYYIGWATDLLIKLLNVDLIIFTGKTTCFMNEVWQYIDSSIGNPNDAKLDCTLTTSTYGALSPAAGAAVLATYPINSLVQWPISD